MPRTTRKRTLIAQARVSEAELAEWRVKAAAAGVGLSELLRRARTIPNGRGTCNPA